uniref:Transposase (Putative), gypsy type n=1 Tax=Tanacetum cinerariifolium TaxID=118510 RepID=A0A6L2N2Q6_TANCI|nr:transposase (putative), gypsy type [Tanacetum cinerariifolium]
MNEQQDRTEKMAQQQQQQAAAFQAQFEALRAKLQASLGSFKVEELLNDYNCVINTENGLSEWVEELEVEKKELEYINGKLADRIKQLDDELEKSVAEAHHLRKEREYFASNEYKQSLGDVFSLAIAKEWVDGISVNMKEEVVQTILADTPNVDLAATATFMAKYEALFDNRYFYVDKQSIDVESTYDNDARDQVSELGMKVLVYGKQDEAKVVKVVVVAVEQNTDEPNVEGNRVIGVGVNENNTGVQYSVSTLHVLILLLERLNDQYIKKKKMEVAIQRRIWDLEMKIIFLDNTLRTRSINMSLGHSDEIDIPDTEPVDHVAEAIVLSKFDIHLLLYAVDLSASWRHEGHIPLLRDLEEKVVTMAEFLRLPNFRGCKITAGDPLSDGAARVTHTTPPTARLDYIPPETGAMEVAEQPCQKVLAEKEKKRRKA